MCGWRWWRNEKYWRSEFVLSYFVVCTSSSCPKKRKAVILISAYLVLWTGKVQSAVGCIQHVQLLWSEPNLYICLERESCSSYPRLPIFSLSLLYQKYVHCLHRHHHHHHEKRRTIQNTTKFLLLPFPPGTRRQEGSWQLHMVSLTRLTAYGILPVQIASPCSSPG